MIRYLTRNAKPSLAYCQTLGKKSPGIIFLSGFMSNMNGQKALAIEEWCRSNDHPFVRFDYRGTGSSEGTVINFKDWIEDAADMMINLTNGEQVVIGSSMGGFIMLHLAHQFSSRIKAMIGVAPSFYFLDSVRSWFADANSHENIRDIPSSYGNYKLSKSFMEGLDDIDLFCNGKKYDLTCPLSILHGMQDDSVPWQKSVKFVDTQINDASHNVLLTLQKDGEHRMSSTKDIDILLNTIQYLISDLTIIENKL